MFLYLVAQAEHVIIFQEHWFTIRLLQLCPCAVHLSSVIQN